MNINNKPLWFKIERSDGFRIINLTDCQMVEFYKKTVTFHYPDTNIIFEFDVLEKAQEIANLASKYILENSA